MKKLLIIGAGGHARPINEIALLHNYDIAGIIDLNYGGGQETILGVPIIGGYATLQSISPEGVHVALAIGDNELRQKEWLKLKEQGYHNFPSLIHPSTIISESAIIEDAVVICAGAIVNPLVKLGLGSIVNTGAIIDHECEIADFVHLAPGTRLAGRVKVGSKTFIGIGTCVIDKIEIGEGVLIGAGSTIIKPIPSNCKIVGVSKLID